MRICIIGAGYVGLVTAAVFADWGHEVVCVDNNESKVTQLQAGVLGIYEPGLPELFARNLQAGRLQITSLLSEAVENRDLIMVTVGTPSRENGHPNLSTLWNVITSLKKQIEDYQIVAIKSTVPAGTCEAISRFLNEEGPVRFDIVSVPEFLSQGTAVINFLSPDRIVIGCQTGTSKQLMKTLYQPLDCSMVFTDWHSAEMIKYASNAFLALKISYINTIANLCEEVGANISHVVLGMGLDPRIGTAYLRPGVGFGGSCLKKDTQSLVAVGEAYGVDISLLQKTLEVNQKQPVRLIEKLEKQLSGLQGKQITVLGLTFKANTNDVREAPSLPIITRLAELGAAVKAYDPAADMRMLSQHFPFTPALNPYDAAARADALVLLTEWDEFLELDFDFLKSLMKNPLIVDGRNLFDPHVLRQKGIQYIPVGISADSSNLDRQVPSERQRQP